MSAAKEPIEVNDSVIILGAAVGSPSTKLTSTSYQLRTGKVIGIFHGIYSVMFPDGAVFDYEFANIELNH